MAVRAPKIDSKEHEMEILGMAMADQTVAKDVANIPRDLFYYSRHKAVLFGIQELVKDNQTVDMLALRERLGDEHLMTIAEIGQCGLHPDMLRQRVDELKRIRFQHNVANLPPETSYEELQELIDKYKPSSEEDMSYIPDKANLLTKIKTYAKEGGLRTYDTGWPTLNRNYTVAKKQLSIVTGIPGHGKSTWVDNLLVNLARMHGWVFCVFAPETYPIEQHYARMIEISTGKSMLHKTTRAKKITVDEIEEAYEFIFDHVKALVIQPDQRSIDNIMSQVSDDYDGFVLDPWNEVEHFRDRSQTETEYIGQVLMKLKAAAIWKDMHIWLVAHPKKMYKENGVYKPPDMYDISGSANWFNKADMGVTVHRKHGAQDWGEIHITKVKVRGTGQTGTVELQFDRDTQRFHEPLTEF